MCILTCSSFNYNIYCPNKWVRSGDHFHLRSNFIVPDIYCSRIAGPMCPVLDPAMVTTVNFFHGNEFYTARRAKLAWLLLARH